MSDEIVIITPEVAPGAGGVADYTLRLVEEWGDRVVPRFILADDIEHNLRDKLPPAGGKVLLQYSAYGFHRYGYPRQLLRTLADWKRTTNGLLVIMFHEIWVFWPLLNKNSLLQRLHRADIARLIVQADAVFTATPNQAGHLQKLVPSCNIQFLPVGSNIRRSARLDSTREPGLVVLFGLQLARLRVLQKMRAELKALINSRVIKRIVTVGAGNTDAGNLAESGLLAALGLTNGFAARGAVAEAEVSKLLAGASFALSSQDELSITKSGTFMACAAHETNMISRAADPLAAEPVCWLTSPEELQNGISPNELKVRAEHLRAWQERTASWPFIAERFADALKLKKEVRA